MTALRLTMADRLELIATATRAVLDELVEESVLELGGPVTDLYNLVAAIGRPNADTDSDRERYIDELGTSMLTRTKALAPLRDRLLNQLGDLA